jgi:hypothetical protein
VQAQNGESLLSFSQFNRNDQQFLLEQSKHTTLFPRFPVTTPSVLPKTSLRVALVVHCRTSLGEKGSSVHQGLDSLSEAIHIIHLISEDVHTMHLINQMNDVDGFSVLSRPDNPKNC